MQKFIRRTSEQGKNIFSIHYVWIEHVEQMLADRFQKSGISLQLFALMRKGFCQCIDKSFVSVGKEVRPFPDNHFVEQIVHSLPRQIEQPKITEERIKRFAFTQSSDIMKTRVERYAFSPKSL